MAKQQSIHGFRKTAIAVLVAAASAVPFGAGAQVNSKWVTVVLPAEPPHLDGCRSSAAVEGRIIKLNVIETLTQRNPKDGSINPRLATSWEQIDPSTWRVKLRTGVTFHDGSPFNATTAKKSMDRTMTGKGIVCTDRVQSFGGLQMDVKIVDDYTLELKTSRPEPILPLRLSRFGIVGPDAPEDKHVIHPTGTGPYVFEKHDPTEISLKRNEKYWGAKPIIEGAKFIWRNESAVRASMVKIGEADIALAIGPQDATDPVLDHSFFNGETTSLRLDTILPPLNDKRVRLALSYALDRASMIGTVMPKTAIQATQLILPSIPGHNHDLDKRMIPYDPAKAKQLLAEAKASGVPVDTEIRLVSFPGQYPNSTELMEAFTTMYRAVGLNMKIVNVESAGYNSYNNKPFPENRPPVILQNSHDNVAGDPVFTVFYKFGCEGVTSAYCDAYLDKETLRVSDLSGEARIKGWQEIFRYLYEDAAPSVILYHMVGFARVGPRTTFVPDITSNAEVRLEEIKFK